MTEYEYALDRLNNSPLSNLKNSSEKGDSRASTKESISQQINERSSWPQERSEEIGN